MFLVVAINFFYNLMFVIGFDFFWVNSEGLWTREYEAVIWTLEETYKSGMKNPRWRPENMT